MNRRRLRLSHKPIKPRAVIRSLQLDRKPIPPQEEPAEATRAADNRATKIRLPIFL